MDDNLLKEGLLWFTSHKIQIHSLIFLDTRPKMSEIVLQTIDDLGFFFDTAWYENCSWIFLTNNFWYSGIQSKKVLEKVTCFVPLIKLLQFSEFLLENRSQKEMIVSLAFGKGLKSFDRICSILWSLKRGRPLMTSNLRIGKGGPKWPQKIGHYI